MQESEADSISQKRTIFMERLVNPLDRLVQALQSQQAPLDALVDRANRQVLIEDASQRCESVLADALPCEQRFPYQLQLQSGDQSEALNPDSWLIPFAPAQSEGLAIVGQSGSGKSFLLHSLALELLDQIGDDESAAVPILLSLASWNQQRSFEVWLHESLAQRFCTKTELIANLLKKVPVILLLDDFDQIALAEQKQGCLTAIQSYLEAQQTALVICCDPESYQDHVAEITAKALLPQNIPFERVEQIVNRTDRSALQHMLLALPQFAELSQNPLMLKLMLGAYRHNSVPSNLVADPDRLREQLIEESIAHSGEQDPMQITELKQSLGWLAHNLQKHKHGNEFQIEWLQTSWLQPSIWRWLWSITIFVSICIIGCIISVGWIMLMFGLSGDRRDFLNLAGVILPIGLSIGLLGALPKAVDQIYPRERIDWSTSAVLPWVVPTLIGMFHVGSVFGGLFLLPLVLGQFFRLGFIVFVGTILVMQLIGLVVALVKGTQASKIAARHIPNQAIQGSAKSFLLGMSFAALIGFSISVILFLTLILFVISWFAIDGGISLDPFRSIEFIVVLFQFNTPLTMLGCFIGFVSFGGAALLQHYFLRVLLWLSGLSPLDLPAWLEEASKIGLIVRFGGSYRFRHPSIQAALAKSWQASQE